MVKDSSPQAFLDRLLGDPPRVRRSPTIVVRYVNKAHDLFEVVQPQSCFIAQRAPRLPADREGLPE